MRPTLSTLTTALAALTVALVLVVVVVVVLVVRRGDPASTPDQAQAPAVTTLAQLAATEPEVARAAFCDRVPTAGVTDALGGEVAGASDYGNGDTARLGTLDDVAHEYGCSWTSSTGTVARAWVFAPPVSTARAGRLVALAARETGCVPATSQAYGDPSTATTCTTEGAVASGRAGLFGDAWLSCTLTTPTAEADLAARSDAWCVAVAVAASSPAS